MDLSTEQAGDQEAVQAPLWDYTVQKKKRREIKDSGIGVALLALFSGHASLESINKFERE